MTLINLPAQSVLTVRGWREVCRFFVHGEPKGQPRPRAFARKMGDKFVARVYDAGTAEGWKSCIAVAAKPYLPAVPLAGPIRLIADFYFERPRSHYRTGKNSHVLKPGAPLAHLGKPDFDNLLKAVADALTVLGMWRDDGLICSAVFNKFYGGNLGPGCWITVETWEEAEAKR